MATIIEMPKLSDTMSVGTVKWHKRRGDKVSEGGVWRKSKRTRPRWRHGKLRERSASQGFCRGRRRSSHWQLWQPLGKRGSHRRYRGARSAVGFKRNRPAPRKSTGEGEGSESTPQKESPLPASAQEHEPTNVDGEEERKSGGEAKEQSEVSSERILASPLAKKIAREQDIDLSQVKGSGPSGRVTKKDVLSHREARTLPEKALQSDQAVKPAAVQSSGQLLDQVVPVSKMRSIIARRLHESKSTIPHFYLQKEIDSQPLRLAREAINERLAQRSSPEEKPLKLTLNDLILKACAETIKWVPEINTSWENDHIRYHGNVHLAFGVAVEDGL